MNFTPEQKKEMLKNMKAWLKTPEGKNEFNEAVEKALKEIKPLKNNWCECCYCISQRNLT